jgi:hypothetical protein
MGSGLFALPARQIRYPGQASRSGILIRIAGLGLGLFALEGA